MAEYKKTPGSNMNDWANALKRINPKLSAEINEERTIGFKNLDRLGLPRNKRISLPLENFLKAPEEALHYLGSELFYITLAPAKSSLSRFSTSGLDAEEVNNYIKHNIPNDLVPEYDIVIQQFFENLYGGIITINPDGFIHIEFAEGKQGPISKGTKTPDYIVIRDKHTRMFRYSFEDEDLRMIIYKTLQAIPHWGEGRDTVYNPGYYEFAIIKEDEKDYPRPIFIDFKKSKTYYLPS